MISVYLPHRQRPFFPWAWLFKNALIFYLILKGQVKSEEGFDLTPAELITGIITEAGTFKPENVVPHMRELDRYFGVFRSSVKTKHY